MFPRVQSIQYHRGLADTLEMLMRPPQRGLSQSASIPDVHYLRVVRD
jgi:hypothetical protein